MTLSSDIAKVRRAADGSTLAEAVDEALRMPQRRISRLILRDRQVWLKQVERPQGIRRLQKGDSRRAFEADRAALRDLGRRGLPVAPILAEGPDHFVTPDIGLPLFHILRAHDEWPLDARRAAFASAGAALAALHAAGVAHGRPSIRDICWDGTRARFIDFERYSAHRNRPRGLAGDVVVFVYSIFAYGPDAEAELAAAVEAYRRAAPAAIWPLATARARRLGWLSPVARLARVIRPRSRELAALPRTIAFFRTT